MNLKRLLPIYLGAIIGPMGGVGIITLLPVLCKHFDISIQWASLTITLYMIPYVIFQLFSGSIAQVFDTRRTLLFGFGTYALGSLLSGLSFNLATLIAARFVQGFGAAFIAPIVLALVGEMVDRKHTGRAMGILGVMYTIGVTMGPLLSGVLEVSLGWAWFFFFLMAFSLSIGILYWYTGRDDIKSSKRPGTFADALALVRKSYSYPEVKFLSLAAFCLFLGYIGLMTFVADYLKVTFSLASDKTGLILSMTGFFGIVAAPMAGVLGDRKGRIPIAFLGGVIMVVAVLGLATVEYTYKKYLFLFALFGAGSATAWTSLNTLAVEVVPDLRKPVASVYNCFKFSGYALSPLLLSLLYVPFSISGVRWACIACILISLLLASRIRTSKT
ncbi:MAG: MFS transporter [Syntrophaceae bacterium]|jgi:MFS family permease|nr:MFS transporter [Syntrophaceae bacterium]